jgi:hypothetical protein
VSFKVGDLVKRPNGKYFYRVESKLRRDSFGNAWVKNLSNNKTYKTFIDDWVYGDFRPIKQLRKFKWNGKRKN